MLRTTYNASTKSWFGPKNVPFYSNRASLGLIAVHSLGLNPSRVLQICADDGTRVTAGELRRDILAVVENLHQAFGIARGDVIGIVAKNSKHLAALVFGALAIGAPFNPLDPSLSSDEIAQLFNHTRPRLIVCDADVEDKVQTALRSLESYDVPPLVIIPNPNDDAVTNRSRTNIEELFKKESKGFWPPDLGDTDYLIGAIFSSSGSTGPPKAVAITQTILKYYSVYSDYGVSSEDIRFCFSTLHWYSGVISVLSPIVNCVPFVITRHSFSPDLAVKLIREFQISYVIFPSRQLTLLSEYLESHPTELPSLRQVYIGGSLAVVKHIKSLARFLPNGIIGNFYGMTEFFGLLGKRPDVSAKYCVGQFLTDCEVKLVDDSGRSLGTNERGEVLIKPWFPCLGYYDQGSLTQECMSEDGFVKSGDIGYIDSDGDLHIVDRIKETFKYNNFHVSPSELEASLLTLNGVFMAQVVGIPAECGVNHLAAAFIIRENKADIVPITAADIHSHVQAHFSEPKWLHGGVHFLDEFPTTVSGKVSKRLLGEWLMNRE